MKEEIEYLKNNVELSNVLSEGFAQIYRLKPQFPVSFLAQYLKSHNTLEHQKKELIRKLINNQTIRGEIKREEEIKQKQRVKAEEQVKRRKQKHEGFEFRIKENTNHEEFLNQFCEWVEEQKSFGGVYIGELEHQFKKIDLQKEDGEEAHIDTENPKVIKFKAASHSHNSLMIGKTLSQESVVGKLLTEKPQEGGGEQQEGKKEMKPKGEIFIPLVQQNKQLHFFKYPRLGSFYAIAMKIKSYLHEKLFDANIIKFQTYRKAKEEYQKEQEQRQTKFRQLYDERAASGADEKELEELEQNFQKEEENFPKPKLQEYEFIQRDFVVCFDTLGLDREISEQQKSYCRFITDFLKDNWEKKERELLQKDIDAQLKQNLQNTETPLQEVLNHLMDEEEKELPTNQEVEKVKANQKLMQLEINTLRIEKVKEYMEQQKNVVFLQSLLEKRVIKYAEIMKIFLIFAGQKKEEINFKGINVMNWLKAKNLLSKDYILATVTQFTARGSKPSVVLEPYAKWQRILKCLEKYDQTTVASYNIYLAFILRFLQLCGKVRIADNEARRAAAKAEREAREERIKDAQLKNNEKLEKLQNAKAEAEAKDQAFDDEGWLRTYEQQNPVIEIGQQVVEQKDADLQEQAAQIVQ